MPYGPSKERKQSSSFGPSQSSSSAPSSGSNRTNNAEGDIPGPVLFLMLLPSLAVGFDWLCNDDKATSPTPDNAQSAPMQVEPTSNTRPPQQPSCEEMDLNGDGCVSMVERLRYNFGR